MEGRASEVQTGAFLIALRTKGETVPELIGLARTMRSLAEPVDAERGDLVDTAGTGGGPSTFNVSTTAAIVAAGAGCAVAKHGNRSSTSQSGSADLLEALGVNIELDPAGVGSLDRRDRLRLHVRAAPSQGDGACGPGPQGTGRTDDLQLPRSADQPGRRQAPGARGFRPPLPGVDRRSPGRAGHREGAGGFR